VNSALSTPFSLQTLTFFLDIEMSFSIDKIVARTNRIKVTHWFIDIKSIINYNDNVIGNTVDFEGGGEHERQYDAYNQSIARQPGAVTYQLRQAFSCALF
jgi:hypothetical protein